MTGIFFVEIQARDYWFEKFALAEIFRRSEIFGLDDSTDDYLRFDDASSKSILRG